MPLDPQSATAVTGFKDVPDFAKGLVRDIRVRWACEEIGRAYRPELLNAFQDRPEGYRRRQPFGQVPTFEDGTVSLFESGAILLYLGEQDERLLPRDVQGRWAAIAWLNAALNSVEPPLMNIVWLAVFNAGKDWAAAALPAATEFARTRLSGLSAALADQEWLTGGFTIADIAMVTVLRSLRHSDILESYPNLAAYRTRGEQREGFRQALADQMAGFETA